MLRASALADLSTQETMPIVIFCKLAEYLMGCTQCTARCSPFMQNLWNVRKQWYLFADPNSDFSQKTLRDRATWELFRWLPCERESTRGV